MVHRFAVLAVAAIMLVLMLRVQGQTPAPAVAVDNDDIGGVVTGPRGPEAGVWVVAETTGTPTRLIKSVVTDDRGRFLLPDLPNATYDVWVRGYGLMDSTKVKATPGKVLNLTAVAAPGPRAAAEYYPAQYWFALLQLPPKSDFPGTGARGNGISESIKSQGEWVRSVVNTDGCTTCHQLGGKATRTIPEALGAFPSSVAAWDRRIQSGQAGGSMSGTFSRVGRDRALKMYADWTDRIAAGEYPQTAPPRPQGKERNVVITMWDWADPKVYLHDEITTDKRNPTVNANGPIYGALEESGDYMPVVDPVRNTASQVKLTVRDQNTPRTGPPTKPSAYWGDESIWTSQTTAHSFAMDKEARVWVAARIRPNPTPAFCKQGSTNPSAKLFPIDSSGRQIEFYDPKTKQVTTIDTCFGTHHLNFDNSDKLWFSGAGANVEGWFDTKVYLQTKDESKAQGWTVFVLDTNGNGKRDDYVEPNQPVDPKKDKRITAAFYAVSPSPTNDNIIWGGVTGMPGAVVRIALGSNPPETALTEYYEVPWNNPKASTQGYAPRGMDVDSNDVVWTVLSSGHFASFDRRKCKVLNGPTATGQHCPEGWKLYPFPGPNYKGAVESGSADSAYYNFVDRFDMLGVGKDVALATGNESEALLALVDGKYLSFRVPYPMGFYAKGLDGRIDNPNGGWKGKAIWTTFATRAPFHSEGGKGTTSKVVKFQVRPDPLAK
jgi:hypothetical protein